MVECLDDVQNKLWCWSVCWVAASVRQLESSIFIDKEISSQLGRIPLNALPFATRHQELDIPP